MKTIIKSLTYTTVIFSAVMLITGCNTVQGAFQGAGRDTRAVVNELQLNNPPRHHTVRQTTTQTTTTTRPAYTTIKTNTLSPNPVQSTPDVAQPE